MKQYRCRICDRANPLGGWCENLNQLQIVAYRLAGYLVGVGEEVSA